MSVFGQFSGEFIGAFDRLPVWLPGSGMQVGDVGIPEAKGWQQMSSLRELAITFGTEPSDAPASYSYHSQDAAQVEARLSAESGAIVKYLASARAGFQVKFGRQGAFVFRAPTVESERIARLHSVQEEIIKRAKAGDWEPNWVLVTEVVRARPIIILVAGKSDSEASVDLGAKLELLKTVQLGEVDGGFGVVHQDGLLQAFTITDWAAVMWRGRVRRGWLRKRFRDLGEDTGEEVVGPADDDDELASLGFYPSEDETA
jgi:hypothetical protein